MTIQNLKTVDSAHSLVCAARMMVREMRPKPYDAEGRPAPVPYDPLEGLYSAVEGCLDRAVRILSETCSRLNNELEARAVNERNARTGDGMPAT